MPNPFSFFEFDLGAFAKNAAMPLKMETFNQAGTGTPPRPMPAK